MKNIVTIAAFAALAALAAPGTASAYTLSPDDYEVCRVLELAHESTCAEYEGKLRDQALADAIDSLEATGSTTRAPAPASYIPYVNGAGDPDGLTRSNRTYPVR
jgi:hypothetical protein